MCCWGCLLRCSSKRIYKLLWNAAVTLYCSICWQVYSTSFTYYIYCLQKENIEPQKQRCSTRSGQQLKQPTTSRSTCRTRAVKQLNSCSELQSTLLVSISLSHSRLIVSSNLAENNVSMFDSQGRHSAYLVCSWNFANNVANIIVAVVTYVVL